MKDIFTYSKTIEIILYTGKYHSIKIHDDDRKYYYKHEYDNTIKCKNYSVANNNLKYGMKEIEKFIIRGNCDWKGRRKITILLDNGKKYKTTLNDIREIIIRRRAIQVDDISVAELESNMNYEEYLEMTFDNTMRLNEKYQKK